MFGDITCLKFLWWLWIDCRRSQDSDFRSLKFDLGEITLLVLVYSFLLADPILEGKQHEDEIHIMAKCLEEFRLV